MTNELFDFLTSNGYDYLQNTSESYLPFGSDRKFNGVLKRNYFEDGDTCVSKVYYFLVFDVYIKFKGYYTSYEGLQYDSFVEVTPEEKMVTVFNESENTDITPEYITPEYILECILRLDDITDYDIQQIPGISSVTEVEYYNRDEYGAEAHRVFEIKTNNNLYFFIKAEGTYSSYDGFTVETVKIVSPKEKSITVYE